MAEFEKKVVEVIKANKCQRAGCKSNNQDQLEVAWYGVKFDNKEITCSSCVLRNDQVISRLEPVALNLMPISGFVKKFGEEYTEYNKLKASKDWSPKLDEAKKKELLVKLDVFEKRLQEVLKELVDTLVEFGKRVAARSGQIFTVAQFEEILKMEREENFSKLLAQIEILMKKIYKYSETSYKFVSEADRNAKNSRLKLVIADVSNRTATTLTNLIQQIKGKIDQIHKV